MVLKPWVFPPGPSHWNVWWTAVLLSRMRGLQPDKEAFEKHIAALALKLDVYEKILSKQKYLAGDVGVLPNYVNMNIYLWTFLFLLGDHINRPLSCRFGGRGYKNGKWRAGIGVATKCQEVRLTTSLRVLLPSYYSHSIGGSRVFLRDPFG